LLVALSAGATLADAAERAARADHAFNLAASLQRHVTARTIAGFLEPAIENKEKRR
jgi:hypothetical protein